MIPIWPLLKQYADKSYRENPAEEFPAARDIDDYQGQSDDKFSIPVFQRLAEDKRRDTIHLGISEIYSLSIRSDGTITRITEKEFSTPQLRSELASFTYNRLETSSIEEASSRETQYSAPVADAEERYEVNTVEMKSIEVNGREEPGDHERDSRGR